MSDEQYAWQPVRRMNSNININDRMATYLANQGAKFTITIEGLEAVAALRGDLALCRRVPAQGQGVPVEVREALEWLLDNSQPLAVLEVTWTRQRGIVYSWLDLQEQD